MNQERGCKREVEFVKELPPEFLYKRTNWAKTLEPLRDRPEEWALLKETDSSGNAYTTTKFMRKHLQDFKDFASFTIVVKRPEIGKWAIYGKYSPEGRDEHEAIG